MTVYDLINHLYTLDPKLPVYSYSEAGYMKEIKHKPVKVTLKATTKYEAIELILIDPVKP